MTRILIFATILTTMVSCIVEDKEAAKREKIAEVAATYNTTEDAARNIIQLGGIVPPFENIIYFRDPRTNVCILHVYRKADNGNLLTISEAPVNCELVEKELVNPIPPPPPPPEESCDQKLKQLIDQQATQAPPLLFEP